MTRYIWNRINGTNLYHLLLVYVWMGNNFCNITAATSKLLKLYIYIFVFLQRECCHDMCFNANCFWKQFFALISWGKYTGFRFLFRLWMFILLKFVYRKSLPYPHRLNQRSNTSYTDGWATVLQLVRSGHNSRLGDDRTYRPCVATMFHHHSAKFVSASKRSCPLFIQHALYSM